MPSSGTRTYRAPGRVNVVGEHIDYLGGTVLPFACDLELRVTVEPHPQEVRLRSAGAGEVAVPLSGSAEPPPSGWGRHVWAVMVAVREAGFEVHGCRGRITSTIPAGAGLSSSTALEVGVAVALTGGVRPPPEVLQHAEQMATGVPCGVMDQTTMLKANPGHALLLDCATGAFEHVPVHERIGFVVVDTGTRRDLSDGRYARRRAEVEDGHPRRRRHAETEQARVFAAADALRAGDVATLGALVTDAHASLRDDFEVSSAALDLAVVTAAEHASCTGARLVGAGFAGCAVAVVEGGQEEEVAVWVADRLKARLPAARAFAVRAVGGAGEAGLRGS